MFDSAYDPLNGFEVERDMLYKSLLAAGIIPSEDVKFGGNTYTVDDGTFFQHNQIPENGLFSVPVMEHNDWQIPHIKDDDEEWTAKIRFADSLKEFTDGTKEVGSLFKPYDMTRLGSTPTHIGTAFVETVMSYIDEEAIVRDPPRWVMALARKSGIRDLKISTSRPDRYENFTNSIVDESDKDIVLSSNLGLNRIGIFLSPAYYMKERKIDINMFTHEDSLELRYWYKGKYQIRYLSRSPNRSYHVSKFGADTLISQYDNETSILGSFQHSVTDFFFFR